MFAGGFVARWCRRFDARRAVLFGCFAVLLIGTAPALAQTVINVTDGASLSAAIAQVDSNASTSYVINLQNNINLSAAASNTLAAFNTTSNVTMNGNNFTLNGGNVQRGFFVYSGTVAINNLTIQNTQALGGAGGAGQQQYGGGGGAGFGGALFVAASANVIVSNVNLSTNNATGGAGSGSGSFFSGAGGGMGGNGGVGGNAGGGGVGLGADGGNGSGGTGGAGIIIGATSGGAGGNGGAAGNSGGGGGASGDGANSGGGGGVGGANGTTSATSGGGGFGGGGAGGANSNGGFGGGGGGGGSGGGNGGFGGGGGGGSGLGGFGGGDGTNNSAGGGGGGAGMGGAIFVQEGGSLTLSGGLTINGNTVTAGAGGGGGSNSGSAFGSGIFLQGNGALTFKPGSGQTQTITDVIADQTGSGGTGANAGAWALRQTGPGMLTLSAANAYSGGTTISAGTLQLAGAGTLGLTSATTTVSGGTLDLGGTTQTQAALNLANGTIRNGSLNAPITSTGGTLDTVGGTASLTTTSGITTLLGINSYTGATNVNGGTLDVEGSITGTSSVTINAGGVLTGAGIVDPLVVTLASGSTFAPGNGTPGTSTTIVGNLALASGALYVVQLNPTTSTFATVTGQATLGGATVNAIYANGSYVTKQYTLLSAGSVSGNFSALVNTNLPANIKTSLSYDSGHVYLDLALIFVPPPGSGLSGNQQNVANTIEAFFSRNGAIPLTFGGLTPAGLAQIAGETATGSQQTSFQAMTQFMTMMGDPSGSGRSDGTGAMAFASDDNAANAYAAMFRKALAPAVPFIPGWSVWAAGFGGSQTTNGNATLGSGTATSSLYGTAVGTDYRLSPSTVAGFALAGGGTNFAVANGGSGHSDLFQAGGFVRHTIGPLYLSAALSYGWQDITTNRTLTVAGGDQLQAKFDANTYAGRFESGYRVATPWMGVTPYAAAQVTAFDLPAYAERSLQSVASLFALAYSAKTITDTRSEFGLRADRSFALPNSVLALQGRLAWAHDFDPNRATAATFQSLPGTSFVVNGTAQASDAALTTASAELKWTNGWSTAATFEGEFSNVTRSHAGKGVVRYQW